MSKRPCGTVRLLIRLASSFVSSPQFDGSGVILCSQGVDQGPVHGPGGYVEDLGVAERAEPLNAQECTHVVRSARAGDDFTNPRQPGAGLVDWRGGLEEPDQAVGGIANDQWPAAYGSHRSIWVASSCGVGQPSRAALMAAIGLPSAVAWEERGTSSARAWSPQLRSSNTDAPASAASRITVITAGQMAFSAERALQE